MYNISEFICDKCCGKGFILSFSFPNNQKCAHSQYCLKCNGKGKMDWVTYILSGGFKELEPDNKELGVTIHGYKRRAMEKNI